MPNLILARATIHLPGLAPGYFYWVDADSQYVKDCIGAGILVPEPDAGDEPHEIVAELQALADELGVTLEDDPVSPQEAPGDEDGPEADEDLSLPVMDVLGPED